MEGFEKDPGANQHPEEEDATELRRLFNALCENGEYTESLLVQEDGTIAPDKRSRESVPPLLVNLFSKELGRRDVESFYQVFRDIQHKLPEFEFSVSENSSRTELTYRIAKRSAQAGS
jgi:hypothetical protein